MEFKPLYDKILVQRNESPKEIGGIHIPEAAQAPQQFGLVVAIGEGRVNAREGTIHPLRVYPGCQVIFGPYSGVEMSELGEGLVLLREDELLAWAEPEAESA